MHDEIADPLKSSAPLIVYLDIKSPYAYLAVEPTYAMARELGIAIDWRPFTLDIVSYLGAARLNEAGKVVEEKRSSGQWTRVKYAYHDVRRYGALRGIVIKGAVKMWDSSCAGMGMLWAKAQGDAVLRKYLGYVYIRFWRRELDLENPAAIEGALSAAGAEMTGLRDYIDGAGRVAYDALQSAAFEAGIFGVPTYVVEGETYFGREHLPRIQWILSGRRGAPPDVSYPIDASAATKDTGSEGKLEVAIDFNSPQAYLAIASTSAMAEELGIAIDWRPFIVTPSKFVATAANHRATRHRRIRSAYLERDIIRYAEARGLRLAHLHDRQDATLAAIGLLWAQRHNIAQRYVELVFKEYWEGQLDLENLRMIEKVLAKLGAPRDGFDGFAAGAGREELARVQGELRGRGVFDTPSYIVNDDVFFGRQHLPLIAATLFACTSANPHYHTLDATALSGSAAPAPISAVVGPVTISATVDRANIVMETGPNRVEVEEYERWAGPLDALIAQTVAANLSRLLGSPQIALAAQANFTPQYRIVINVQRFDSSQQTAMLDALWTVRQAGAAQIRSGRTLASQPVASQPASDDGDFSALAAAQSRNLAQLSNDIAAALHVEN